MRSVREVDLVARKRMDHGERSKSCLLSQLSEDEMLRDLIAENRLQSIHSSEPDLNDIFMEITGRTLV